MHLPKTVRRFLLGLLVAQIGGCNATPVPEPPSRPPPVGVVTMPGFGAAPACPLPIWIGGHAPAGLMVWGINLDPAVRPDCEVVDDSPVLVEVPADGEFVLPIMALPGDEIRLQLRNGALRGPPTDVVVGILEGPLALATRQDCLTVDVELDLGATLVGEQSTATVAIANDCAGNVRVEALALRKPNGSFLVQTATPIDLTPGSDTSIEVEFEPQQPGPIEEILVVRVGDSIVEQRYVSLYGTGRAP